MTSAHTSFAWLGHGAILHRKLISDFLLLTRELGFSESEIKMADNYFSILNNRPAESWFDQGIELGGGQPFTVGTEGDVRNKRHMVSFKLLHFATLIVRERRVRRNISRKYWRTPGSSLRLSSTPPHHKSVVQMIVPYSTMRSAAAVHASWKPP